MKKIKKIFLFYLLFVFVYKKIVNKYYQKHKERLQKEACERYQNLSEEEKGKRRKDPRKY